MIKKMSHIFYLCICVQSLLVSSTLGADLLLKSENTKKFENKPIGFSNFHNIAIERVNFKIRNSEYLRSDNNSGQNEPIYSSEYPAEYVPPENGCCVIPEMIMNYSTFISVRHIDPRGVGYRHGYTTLEGLFFSDCSWGCILPFLDLRFHVFNDGEIAANAGIGCRYDDGSFFTYGFNIYQDYRSEHDFRKHFFQIGVGFEMLSDCVDFRINGYFPFDKKKLIERCVFDDYIGDFFMIKKRYFGTYRGFNAEIGKSFGICNCVDFYTAIGPYYIKSECKRAWGGMFRIAKELFNTFAVEGIVTWDSIFKTRVQGLVSFTFPFGGCCEPKCNQINTHQRIRRNEIIMLDKFCQWETNF